MGGNRWGQIGKPDLTQSTGITFGPDLYRSWFSHTVFHVVGSPILNHSRFKTLAETYTLVAFGSGYPHFESPLTITTFRF